MGFLSFFLFKWSSLANGLRNSSQEQIKGEAKPKTPNLRSKKKKKTDKKRFPKRHTRQHRHTLYDEEGDEGGVGREDEESGQGPGAIRSPLMGESL